MPSPHPLQEIFWRDITFASADIMRLWPEHPETIAYKLAKAMSWSPPEGFSVASLALLPDGKRVPLESVVNLLAFSTIQAPANHPTVDTIAARLRASYALFKAAADKQVKLFGTPAQPREYIGNPIFAEGPPERIDPLEFGNDALALSYLRPSAIGAEKAVARYAEDAVCPQAVKWYDVVVGKKSLAKWFEATLQPPYPRKGGRPPGYDWSLIKAEARRLFLYHGDFSPDDSEWNVQARLEEALLKFCSEELNCEPSNSALRKRIPGWLMDWRKERPDG